MKDNMFSKVTQVDILLTDAPDTGAALNLIHDWKALVIPGYKIQKKIEVGANSTVLLATHDNVEEPVILKVIFPEQYLPDASNLHRFMQEYDIISNIKHPHIIHIYERGFGDNFAYIAMEHLAQGDLKTRIKNGMSQQDAVKYLRQIAIGLGAIHANNILHRDLKPNNILLRDDDSLVITDFGISEFVARAHMFDIHGETLLGTPHFMSPEQCKSKASDQRSDIYSMGIIFYQMLTQKRAFPYYSATKIMTAHINDPIPVLPPTLQKYQAILNGLLAKDPNERFQTTEEVLVGIDWIQ